MHIACNVVYIRSGWTTIGAHIYIGLIQLAPRDMGVHNVGDRLNTCIIVRSRLPRRPDETCYEVETDNSPRNVAVAGGCSQPQMYTASLDMTPPGRSHQIQQSISFLMEHL